MLIKLQTMKTFQRIIQSIIPVSVILLLTGMNAMSQETIEVKNIKAQMSKGVQTCYLVEIPQADLKIVQQNWIKKLQSGIKTKVKEVNQELILEHIVKNEITGDTINIYSLLIDKTDRIVLNVFIQIGDVFFVPKEDKTDLASDKIDNNIINYIRSFAVEQYKLAVTSEFEGEEKVLEGMQDDLEKLQKESENLTKDNSSLENDIEKTEREIKDIESDIEMKNKDIQSHNTSMLTISSDADKKLAGEKQKELEKEKKQLEKNRSRAKDQVSSYKNNIDKNNNEIKENQKLQEDKNTEITEQTEVVAKVKAKLEGIK